MTLMQTDIEAARSVAAELWPGVDLAGAGIVDISDLPAEAERHFSRGASGEEWIECPYEHYGRFRLMYDPGRHELNVSVNDG